MSLISEQTQERFAALRRYLEERRRQPGRWLVLTHDNPDPDALASATALARVLRRLAQRVTVAYGGMIGRAENQEMVRTLKLKLSRVRYLNPRRYRYRALVDCQPRTGNSQLPPEVVPDLVIDHHPLRRTTQGVPLIDVRPAYGATASIVAEYLLAAEVSVTRREATAVVYALRSETLDFSRESPGPDRALYNHFLTLADMRLLGKIQSPRLPLSYYRALHDGLEALETVDSLVISHLGEIAQPDMVAEIADLLLRMEGKTWSLCTGLHGDRVYCSIRTTNPRADASRLMQRMLGRRGKGGGHGMIAGGWVILPSPDRRPRLQRDLGRKLAKMLRKNPDRLAPLRLRPEGTEDTEASPTPASTRGLPKTP